jgi:hypothetical protein
MKSTRKSILRQMAAIQRMERGTLCPMQGGRYHNLQAWVAGRNQVRYVPASQVKATRKAIAGYKLFTSLAQRYADLVVEETRAAAHAAGFAPEKTKGRRN